MVYFITRDVAVVTDLWCLAQVLGSVAPRMGVAEPLRRPTASRGRKRPRAAARLVGTSRAACCRPRLRVNPFLVWFVFLWLLFSGVWETLIFGTGDWIAFGGTFFLWLVYPNLPIAWAQARARITICYVLCCVRNYNMRFQSKVAAASLERASTG